MEIQVIPINHVMNEEQIITHMQNGWAFIGTLLVDRGKQIAVPGQEPGGPVPCNIWVRPEPLMPQRALVAVMIAIAREDGDFDTLNTLSQALFGVGLNDFIVAQEVETQGGLQ
jgi:hypothetical protein